MIAWGALQLDHLLTGRLFRLGAAGGDASYALYLSHPVFLLFAPSNPYALAIFGPPTLIALGFLVHYRLELPLLKFVRRYTATSVEGARSSANA